jgi:hypothetical protein
VQLALPMEREFNGGQSVTRPDPPNGGGTWMPVKQQCPCGREGHRPTGRERAHARVLVPTWCGFPGRAPPPGGKAHDLCSWTRSFSFAPARGVGPPPAGLGKQQRPTVCLPSLSQLPESRLRLVCFVSFINDGVIDSPHVLLLCLLALGRSDEMKHPPWNAT